MKELSQRNRAGALTPAEDEELDNFIRVGDLLAILQSKARQQLKISPEALFRLSVGRPTELSS